MPIRARPKGRHDREQRTTINHLEPLEHAPHDVIVYDRGARRWTVRLSNSGVWVGLLRGARPGYRDTGTRLVTAFNRDSALNLADAVQWAARIAEPRQPLT